jgi:quercetin dioxygenase-like cupin family protein
VTETVYTYTKTDEKIVGKLVGDNHAMINHVVLANGGALPEHYSDSNAYLTIARETLSANTNEEPVEFFIVKAPHPRVYKEQ